MPNWGFWRWVRKDRITIRGTNNCQEQLLNPSAATCEHQNYPKRGGAALRGRSQNHVSVNVDVANCFWIFVHHFFHFCSLGASIIFCHNPTSACCMLQQQCLMPKANGRLKVGLLYLHNTSEMCPLFVPVLGKQFLTCFHTCKAEPRRASSLRKESCGLKCLKIVLFIVELYCRGHKRVSDTFCSAGVQEGFLKYLSEWLHDPWVHCSCGLCK